MGALLHLTRVKTNHSVIARFCVSGIVAIHNLAKSNSNNRILKDEIPYCRFLLSVITAKTSLY